MIKYYQIAGLTVQMDVFGLLEMRARPYEVDRAEPDLVIDADWSGYQNQHLGMTEEEAQDACTAIPFYRSLLNYDGLMIHASAVVKDGRAFLFTAFPGTGKSTHTSLWRRVFGDDQVRILNDDKPAVRLEGGEFFVYGTPWSGKSDQNLNLRVPLGGICVLERGEENTIAPFGGSGALFTLLEQTLRPDSMSMRLKLMELLDKLLQTGKLWKLQCNMKPEAAIVSCEAMCGKGKESVV